MRSGQVALLEVLDIGLSSSTDWKAMAIRKAAFLFSFGRHPLSDAFSLYAGQREAQGAEPRNTRRFLAV